MASEMREPTYWILTALTAGPRHGYAILKDVATLSAGRVELPVTTLYTALERLERLGMIDAAGEEIVDGRRRRYFRMRRAGAEALAVEAQRLEDSARQAGARLRAAGWMPQPAAEATR